jgi:hypothetical protein
MKNCNAQKSAKGILVAATVWSLCNVRAAIAQVGMGAVTPPLGVTSPLGIGAAAPVGATGLPLGATELATPGVSPMTSSSSASGAMTMTTPSVCSSTMGAMQTAASGMGNPTSGAAGSLPGESSATGAISGTSAPTPLFDGTGIAGTASGTCASATTASSSPTASASSPTIGSRATVGRVGIPVGSTELGTGGLSPLPLQSQSTVVPTAPSTVPCPTTGTSTMAGSSMFSGGC